MKFAVAPCPSAVANAGGDYICQWARKGRVPAVADDDHLRAGMTFAQRFEDRITPVLSGPAGVFREAGELRIPVDAIAVAAVNVAARTATAVQSTVAVRQAPPIASTA